MPTYSPKPGDLTRNWLVIDAEDVVLGRLATTVANLLRGKHKPTFAPHMDGGDFVVVINAGKVSLSGKKAEEDLRYSVTGAGDQANASNSLLAPAGAVTWSDHSGTVGASDSCLRGRIRAVSNVTVIFVNETFGSGGLY